MQNSATRDLGALFDAHVRYEFEDHDAAGAVSTMLDDAYVYHVPTMRGGKGSADVHGFYEGEFVNSLPADVRLEVTSRTVGADQVVDEVVMSFTHDVEIPFMLPGVPPTGRKVVIPVVAVVRFEGDKIAHEHIYWDQASVLVQLGLLDGSGLPVTGAEQASWQPTNARR
jgi:carboxymethylenebutenolidase